MTAARLVLASGSAARRQMLLNAGLHFDVVPAKIDEDRLRDDLIEAASHSEIAAELAAAKALAVAALQPCAIVIGSDQILSTGEAILSKPRSRSDARDTLRLLRGRTHWLHSGVAIAIDDRVVWRAVESAKLTMRTISNAELEDYLDVAGEGIFGCVGAYEIEGAGIRLFERVEGDHFTIMGMPLLPLLAELRGQGIA
ncbi:MAG: Maf family protein [Hyphomicrobium sp.]|nr:Maf family protein [Hyphomicrobium sp.]